MHDILDEPAMRMKHLLALNRDILRLEQDLNVGQGTNLSSFFNLCSFYVISY